MKRWVWVAAVAAVAGVGVAVALAAPASAVKPGDAVSLLDSQRGESDPVFIYADDFELVPESVRFAGSNTDGRFWVGVAVDGDVCLIAIVGSPETGGAVCGAPDAIAESGTMMGLQPVAESGLGEVLVYLVPDGTDVSEIDAPWELVGSNVVTAFKADVVDVPPIILHTGGGAIRLTD